MDASSKPMYQPWNEEEFQADVFVRGMTWLQRHLYRALLQAMFFHSTRPFLPADDEVLWVLSGAESIEMWQQNKSKILKRFTAVSDRPELLENKRVTADWERLTDARNKMAELGERSAAVRRTLNGTAQPQKPSKLPIVLTATERTFDDRSNDDRTSAERPPNVRRTAAEQDIVSEVKEKQSEVTGGASAAVLSSAKKQKGGEWKSIAIRHKNVFGKQASVKFKDKFFEACAQYGEDVVLECFDAWATGAKDWVEANGVDQPLFSFFKKLPAEAENIVEINEAVQEEKTLAAQQKQREEQMQAASTERQCKENADRFAVKERVGVESVDDFLKG